MQINMVSKWWCQELIQLYDYEVKQFPNIVRSLAPQHNNSMYNI